MTRRTWRQVRVVEIVMNADVPCQLFANGNQIADLRLLWPSQERWNPILIA